MYVYGHNTNVSTDGNELDQSHGSAFQQGGHVCLRH